MVYFLKIFEILGSCCYLTDSIALKSMLEVWLSSFIPGIDRWRPPLGWAAPPPRGVHQGWLKDRVEIRLGGGEAPEPKIDPSVCPW